MAVPDRYPALVAVHLTASASYTIYRNTHPAKRVLFFDSSGNRYLFCLYTPGFIAVFKSTDQGLTWTELDTANRPAIVATSVGTSPYGCVQKEQVVYVVSGGTLTIDQFNLATGLWGARLTSGGPTVEDPVATAGMGQNARCFPAVRSDGSFVILYQGEAFDSSTRNRAQAVNWSQAGGWGAPQNTSGLAPADFNEEYSVGLTLGDQDNVHLFFTNDTDGASFNQRLYHRTFRPDNTMGSIQDIDPGKTLGGSGFDISCGTPATLGSIIFIPYYRVPFSGSEIEVAVVAGYSADAPTWSTEIPPGLSLYPGPIANAAHFPPQFNPPAGVDDGGCVLTAFAGDTARFIALMSGQSDLQALSVMYAGDFGVGWEFPRVGYNAYQMQTIEGAAISDSRIGLVFESIPSGEAGKLGIFYVETDTCDCGGISSGESTVTEGCLYSAH